MTGKEWFRAAHERFPRARPGESDRAWAKDLSRKAEDEGVMISPDTLRKYIGGLRN